MENVINIKGVYSPLITQLVEENKRNNKNQYDDSENVVVNIFIRQEYKDNILML